MMTFVSARSAIPTSGRSVSPWTRFFQFLMTVTAGAFDQKNFEDYPILRMDEVPEVDIHLVDSTEAPTGIGEPPVTVVAPALPWIARTSRTLSAETNTKQQESVA